MAERRLCISLNYKIPDYFNITDFQDNEYFLVPE